ncbi:hypothetical protein BC936DRAFT_136559 [Jimgerdemannia flammicorona]|uniref:Uncharacterized protein n=1 Tax=Jimgerdemannia flammicorona TaxID=994334 RepID=A0A433CZA9_9FUNG|nr:hypothetical protein BC936DRAFT_136559 [Jimgerdemannia flammicorona]
MDLDPRIIEDIYSRTNRYAGLVCLCGRAIESCGFRERACTSNNWSAFSQIGSPNTPDGEPGPMVILELLATSTNSEINVHYERVLEYAKTLNIRHQQNPSTQGSSLNIRDIWVVHLLAQMAPLGRIIDLGHPKSSKRRTKTLCSTSRRFE